MRVTAMFTGLLWIAALASVQHARAVRAELVDDDTTIARRIPWSRPVHAGWPADSLTHWGGMLVRYNPFRETRTSFIPPVAEVEEVEARMPVAEPIPVRHVEEPSLKGIVGSAGVWDAVLLIPATGRGTLVRAGDSLGAYHVREVTSSEVLLQGPDSLLRLTLTGNNPSQPGS